ncbi:MULTISPECIES: glycosyltransferase [unclassified Pseudomonas]|uniref:glycosyltransferase n=1 Tax=unclassified Pseudomonas TaxID=196821 RepID=UPI00091398AE|nr:MULTISPECIES: glycosyltransferase [unclassified Pseudomonas]ROO33493.1 glycosyl transferase family 2 [Pseudomonas sp. 7SR1]SFX15053.1 Glycosyltransferase, GT2 family [Pseudomonas sp. NFACC49-2]SFX45195.1 Glycosyltransferase, GT2 family [Pseudomonas sp. NFACC36]SIS22703.1 Glycosyltransferase, GT2 family [Pseudomonas sp. 7SR1]
MSLVSIVIPMYNEARHIGRTLLAAQQAARQAQLECELIVVDNGSDDHGPRIANELGARVLIVPGVHIGALRNRGAALASGQWLAFIDADIEMPADWLTLMLELEGQGDVLGLDLETPRQAPWFAEAWQRRSQRADSRPLHRVQWLPSANLLMRRSWFDRVGGFDETLRTGEDKDFSLRLRQAGARLLLVNDSLALHWGYEGSWREWMSKELWRQGSHLQLLRSHGPSLRLLRFPALSIGAWGLDFLALVALLQGQPRLALLILLAMSLPALILSLRQSRRDPRLTLQLWALHGVRLHLTGAALLLNLCHWTVRRPARG